MSISLSNLQCCDMCGGDHETETCPDLGLEEESELMQEPQMTKARLTLPAELAAADTADGSVLVIARQTIGSKTKFGPYEARRTTSDIQSSNGFILKVFTKDGLSISLDTSDENTCNWLCLVRVAQSAGEQNIVAYQNGTDLCYVVTKSINEGEELKVWYAPHYAKKLGKTAEPDGLTAALLGQHILEEQVPLFELPENLGGSGDTVVNQKTKFIRPIGAPGFWKFNCKRCGQVCGGSAELAKHVREKHIQEFGGRTFRRPGRPRKIPGQEKAESKQKLLSVASKFQCMICNTFCHSSAALRRHLKLHTKEGNTPCPHCSALFAEIYALQDHMQKEHGKGIVRKASALASSVIKTDNEDSNMSVEPSTTGGTGDTEIIKQGDDVTMILKYYGGKRKITVDFDDDDEDDEDMDIVIDDDDDYKPPIHQMSKTIKRHKRGRPPKTRLEGVFGCIKCGKVYGTTKALDAHICSSIKELLNQDDTEPSTEKENLNECQHCNKGFTKKEYLEHHVIRMHESNFSCNQCQRNFITEEGLNKHNNTCMSSDMQKLDEQQYDCELCHVVFSKEKYLYRHIAMHTGEYTCQKCHTSVSTKETLLTHLTVCNPDQLKGENTGAIIACTKCYRVFGSKVSLENHLVKHASKYKCDKCEKSYTIKENFDTHICQVEDPNASYSCRECSKTFNKYKYLIRHEKLHTDRFQCSLCAEIFVRKDDLTRHAIECLGHKLVEKEGKIVCQYCPETFIDPELFRNHVESHTHAFACPKCNKRFIRKTNMNNHIPNCTNLKIEGLNCNKCGKRFRDARYLERHLITHQAPQYQCEHCSKKFFRKDYLNAHTCKRPDGVVIRTKKRKHAIVQEDPHVCYVCGKSYLTKSNLNKHLLTHGEKLFTCDVCGKAFFHQHAKDLHQKTVHSSELKCQCIQCGKLLKTPATLYAHIKQFHSDGIPLYPCETCGKQFRQKGNLIKHEMMHTGKRNFSCSHCDKTFKYPEQLHRHELGHTRGKTFECEHCDRKFVMSFELKKHMRDFHSGVVFVCQFCTEVCRWRHTIRRHIKRKHEQYAQLLEDPAYLPTLIKSTDEMSESGRKLIRKQPSVTPQLKETEVREIHLPQTVAQQLASGIHIQNQTTEGVDIQTVQTLLADNLVSHEAAEALQSLSAGLVSGQNFTIVQNGQEITVNVVGTGQDAEFISSAEDMTTQISSPEDASAMIMESGDADVETAMAAISSVGTSAANVVTDTDSINFTEMSSQLTGNVTAIGEGKEQYLLVTWNPPEGQDSQ